MRILQPPETRPFGCTGRCSGSRDRPSTLATSGLDEVATQLVEALEQRALTIYQLLELVIVARRRRIADLLLDRGQSDCASAARGNWTSISSHRCGHCAHPGPAGRWPSHDWLSPCMRTTPSSAAKLRRRRSTSRLTRAVWSTRRPFHGRRSRCDVERTCVARTTSSRLLMRSLLDLLTKVGGAAAEAGTQRPTRRWANTGSIATLRAKSEPLHERSEVRGQGQRSEFRSQRSEVRGQRQSLRRALR